MAILPHDIFRKAHSAIHMRRDFRPARFPSKMNENPLKTRLRPAMVSREP